MLTGLIALLFAAAVSAQSFPSRGLSAGAPIEPSPTATEPDTATPVPSPSPTPSSSATTTPTFTPSTCGNDSVEGSEECDDGNQSNADGCSATCQLEDPSARCAGIPSSSATSFDAQLVASGLTGGPVFIHAPPLDPTRLFIVQQSGVITVIRNGVRSVFLDINARVTDAGGEQGLLSMAFHPDYENNGRFFVNYINNSGNSVIARYQVTADLNVADPNSELILRTINRPASNHNGGQLAFGPDGLLYFGMGDSGGGGDPGEVAQSLNSLLGKILRFDVNVAAAPYYSVPPSNPNAAAGDPLGLIWAFGLRNPWRFSFDRATGDLYIGDVGQNQKEEIDYQAASSTGLINYGWDVFEGTNCFEPAPQPNCPNPPTGFTFPIHEYDHPGGCSVTGGFVYRGCALPALQGRYFFSDFCNPFIHSLLVVNGVAISLQSHTSDLDPPGSLAIGSISSYGEDARGELYITDLAGEVFKIVPGAPTTPSATATITRTLTTTSTPVPTATRSATATASNTATRTLSATATVSFTRTPSATVTATRTNTAASSTTPTESASPTPTASTTSSPSNSPTPSPTTTHSHTATPSASATVTRSQTATPTATPTDSPSPSPTLGATVTATLMPTATPTVAAATPTPVVRCEGDCNGDGRVPIDELVRAVRISLGALPLSQCPAFGDVAAVRIEQLVRAVASSLSDCATP